MEGRPQKRVRLSMACNACRQRKVKCDTLYPKCRRCHARNEECHTTSVKEPGIEIERTWLDLPEPAPSPIPPTNTNREQEVASGAALEQPSTLLDRPPGGDDVDSPQRIHSNPWRLPRITTGMRSQRWQISGPSGPSPHAGS